MAFLTEADTCRKYVLPKLYEAGWTDEQISEQRSFTDGRIMVTGTKVKRKPQKRADYLLRYRRDFPIAVVEAKTVYNNPGDGLQQAKEYAQILGLKFAYATNGQGFVEHDFLTGRDNDLQDFPSADTLWSRLRAGEGIDDKTAERVLAPYYHLSGKSPRYYQEIAINRAVQRHPPKQAENPSNSRYGNWQDGHRLPNLLQALEFSLEPHWRAAKTPHPLLGRPQRFARRS